MRGDGALRCPASVVAALVTSIATAAQAPVPARRERRDGQWHRARQHHAAAALFIAHRHAAVVVSSICHHDRTTSSL